MNFSKSKYTSFFQCHKIAWLDKYKPDQKEIDSGALARMAKGNAVGDLAMSLFGEFIEVTAKREDGSLDLNEMKAKTTEYIHKGVETICEAAFDFNGLYCAVDILHKEADGYAIYEVKSKTKLEYYHLVDVAYQKYVLEKCGIKVVGVHVVHINNKYVRHGALDIKKLFTIEDVSDLIADEYKAVEHNLSDAEKILILEQEPDIDIGKQCTSPYQCSYWKYCTRNFSKPNVFDLYSCNKKAELYKKGIVSFSDIKASGEPLTPIQLRQVDYALNEKGTYADKTAIDDFLKTLSFPLYFLDFETMQDVIPQYEGTTPYEQIPFQYSLHYIENEAGELKHKEFLAVSGKDPRRKIAESLCENIPKNVCVLAYNKQFECGQLKKLARQFPDLSTHLLNIKDNVKDLLVPFRKGAYYNKAMGGSFSIKSVLPAIFPNDPSLDYHNLNGVQNGTDAMTIFPLIKDMPPKEQEITRNNLLRYCELDTFAMVKVWQELVRISKTQEN